MRRSTRRTIFQTRAPRKGTLIIASGLYVIGLFSYLGWLPLGRDLSVAALTVAGGLLILGALLRDL